MKKQNKTKQNKSNAQEPLFDFSTIAAVVAIGLMWFMWQSYMNKKYPPQKNTSTSQSSPAQSSPAAPPTSPTGPTNFNAPTRPTMPPAFQANLGPEKFVVYEDEVWRLQISSHNMGLKSARLKTYKDSQGQPIELVAGADFNTPIKPFSLQLLMQGHQAISLNFRLSQKNNLITGTAFFKGLKIVRQFRVKKDQFYIEATTQVEKAGADFIGLQMYTTAKVDTSLGETSLLIPTFERQEFYVDHQKGNQRVPIDSQTGLSQAQWAQVYVASLGTQYFSQSVLDRSSVRPSFQVYSAYEQAMQAHYVYGRLDFSRLNQNSSFKTDQVLFLGPKKYALLARIKPQMANIIDFGWFSSIAKGILFLMQFFNQHLSNWGFIIILLTVIVRFLVLPFNLISYKSMRTMAKVQPLIKQIQEKYKDKPAEKNQHIMQLMRDNKANPLMGCLPMLLQIPVFFALYRVLASSVDLYHAPFVLWIHDLSTKDPYYILPILVGVCFFVQQKITPNTMDETQRKVMMFLPLMFTAFMLNLPSGLTLYIFINTLFGLVQQYIFTKRTV